MRAFQQIDTWSPTTIAAAVITADTVADVGPRTQAFRLASVTKALFAYAVLVAVEEGTLDLDQVIEQSEPAVPGGATVAHLLSHSSGAAAEQRGPEHTVAPHGVGNRRIYSNYGFELLGRALEASATMTAAQYFHEAVVVPLAMNDTVLEGSPAHGAYSTVADLARFAAELLRPTLISEATLARATTAHLGHIAGVLPGYGRQEPNPWGLGFEIRGHKSPHWTGALNSPGTYGHFGRSGTFLWVDPALEAACVVLTDKDFGPWAASAWPPFSDAVVTELAG